MHSSNAPDEFAGPTAMGSVQNVNLPMIRPIIILDNIKDPTLVQAQESAQLLFSMINAPVLSFELIPDLTQMLQQSQQQIVVMISEGNAPESVLMQALQVNDIVNQVLEDAQAIANGTKRRYQEEVNVAKLMLQHSDSQNPSDKNDGKDNDDDDEPRLEESVSIDEADKNYSIKQPDNDKLMKKRPSKKSKRQSVDLLNMNSVDLMSAESKNPPKKKEESEEDLMGFLGMQQDANNGNNNNGNVKPQPPKPTVFDPLEDDSNPPPPAYTGANYGNNNQNVFRQQNNGNYNNNNNNGNYNNGNYNNNNGNYNNNNNGNVFRGNNNNNGNVQGASHRKLNTIARGNKSVLDVLTGEKSPSQSDQNSSNSSIKQSPQQNKQQPKQQYNLGGPAPSANNNQKKQDDPFAGMDDPFADMGGATFDDIMNEDKKSPGNDAPQIQQQQQPRQQPKQQPKPQPKPQPVPPKPAPPQHQDSNALILGMFTAGIDDKKQEQKPQQSDNPFGGVDINPFGSDNNINDDNDDNDDIDDDNPFALFDQDTKNKGNNPFSPNDNNNDDFMGDRDPFADM